MCGRRPAVKHCVWHGDDCGRDAVMCLTCWCSHSSRLLALMWFARRGLIKGMGSTPVTQRRFSHLDDRPINIIPSAPPQTVTPYDVFVSLSRCNLSPPLWLSPHHHA